MSIASRGTDGKINNLEDSATVDGLYRLLVESISDYAIYMLDPQGNVVSWNAGASRFKGYAAKEVLGTHFSRFYRPADRERGLPARALRHAMDEGRFEDEGWHVRKDGSEFWAHVIIDPIHDRNGVLIGFAKITRDLTERRQAEEQLRKAEQQFRLLVQGVTDYAIYMMDAEGRVNSSFIGPRDRPKVRFPGGGGAPAILPMAKRVIVWRAGHTPKIFVEKVEFVTSTGNVDRVVTPLCVFRKENGRLVLESIHPGVTRQQLAGSTGFKIPNLDDAPETPEPTAEELSTLREIDSGNVRRAEFGPM